VLDELNQLVKVVPLVLRHSSGEGTRETGLKELYASPLNHCLQNCCFVGTCDFCHRFLRHIGIRKSGASGLQSQNALAPCSTRLVFWLRSVSFDLASRAFSSDLGGATR
jgi:hypothetical protein